MLNDGNIYINILAEEMLSSLHLCGPASRVEATHLRTTFASVVHKHGGLSDGEPCSRQRLSLRTISFSLTTVPQDTPHMSIRGRWLFLDAPCSLLVLC